MSESTYEVLDDSPDPQALWPTGGPGLPGDDGPEPRPWVWVAMDPPERRARLRELATWVNWLTATFELHNTLMPCWYRHQSAIEHLTALYAGWVRIYLRPGDGGRDLAEADWLSTLHALLPRINLRGCTHSHHTQPPSIPAQSDAADALEDFLLTSPFGTRAAHHPAPEEALRLLTEEPPL